MRVKIIVAVAALVLASCSPSTASHSESPAPANRIGVPPYTTVYRVVDREMGIVCYVTYGTSQKELHCLPLPQKEG